MTPTIMYQASYVLKLWNRKFIVSILVFNHVYVSNSCSQERKPFFVQLLTPQVIGAVPNLTLTLSLSNKELKKADIKKT